MKSFNEKVFYTKIHLFEGQAQRLVDSLPVHKVQVDISGLREENPERDSLVKGFLKNLVRLPIDSEVKLTKDKNGMTYSFETNNKSAKITFHEDESKAPVDIIQSFLKSRDIVRFNNFLLSGFGINLLGY